MENSITIILPVFNEEKRIHSSLERLLAFNKKRKEPISCLIIDDGSTDGTYQIVEAFSDRFPWLDHRRLERNLGKGEAVRHGIMVAKGDLLFFMDADLPVPLTTVTESANLLKKGADMVIGSRSHPESRIIGQTKYRKIFSSLGNLVIRATTGLPFHDTQCGFKGFRAQSAKMLFSNIITCGYMFDVEILLKARKLGLKIVDLPVEWTCVQDGSFKPIRECPRALRELYQIMLHYK